MQERDSHGKRMKRYEMEKGNTGENKIKRNHELQKKQNIKSTIFSRRCSNPIKFLSVYGAVPGWPSVTGGNVSPTPANIRSNVRPTFGTFLHPTW